MLLVLPKRKPSDFSKLLIDPDTNVNEKGGYKESVGKGMTLEVALDQHGGGYLVVDGSDNFEIEKAIRHLTVDFSEKTGQSAVISVRDQLGDHIEHQYVWQLKPGEGVDLSAAEENGSKTLVLQPEDVEVVAEELLQVKATGKEIEFKIVMELAKYYKI